MFSEKSIQIRAKLQLNFFEDFWHKLEKLKEIEVPMSSEVLPEGIGPIYGCVGPKNTLEIKKFKKLK